MLDKKLWERIRQKYTSTKKWKSVVERVADRDGHRCRLCTSTEHLICHHSTYEHFMEGGELEENDCITVCNRCHMSIHRRKSVRKYFDETKERFLDTYEEQPENKEMSEAQKHAIRYYYWKKTHKK